MNITKVSLGKTIPNGSFSSIRIDMEATIDEGETPEQVLLSLSQRIDQYHKQSHPELYSSEQNSYPEILSTVRYETQQEQQLTPSQKIINQIKQCSDITVLKSFELLAKNNTEIKTVYQVKLNELGG